MKNRILSLLVLMASFSAGHAVAQGYGDYDPYSYGSNSGGEDEGLPIYLAFNISMNQYSEDGLTTSHGAGLGLGWRFDDMWALELAMKDLGDTGPGSAGFDVLNYELVAKAFWPLTGDKSGIYAKFGLAQHKVDMKKALEPIIGSHGGIDYDFTDELSFDTTAFGPALGVGYQFLTSEHSGFFVELMLYSISSTVERSASRDTNPDPNIEVLTNFDFEYDVDVGVTSINVGVVF